MQQEVINNFRRTKDGVHRGQKVFYRSKALKRDKGTLRMLITLNWYRSTGDLNCGPFN